MHICVLSLMEISATSPNWGGVQTHTKNLVHLLLKEGHQVSFITTGTYEDLENGALNIISINGNQSGRPNKLWFEKAKKAFLEIHDSHPVDCVFSEGGAVRGLMKMMTNLKIPVVTFVHLLSIHYFYNIYLDVDGLRSLKSYLFRTLPTIIYDIFKMDIAYLKKCQKVVTGSYTIARQMQRYYYIPQDRIVVIHNWVEANEFKKDGIDRSETRKQLSICENDTIFLYVGALTRKKGIRVLLHSFKEFLKIIPNAYLFIAGEGQDRTYIEKFIIQSKELTKNVKLLGLYPHSKLSHLFSSADVFIIPSLMNEVLPYTLLEAMSCELPVIATNIAANREALGDAGLFFPRGNIKSLTDAMLTFASDPNKRKTHAMNNKKRVLELFSRETASIKINKLLDEFYK